MSKKIIVIILSFFIFTSCASVSEKGNSTYDSFAKSISKGYESVKNAVTGRNK